MLHPMEPVSVDKEPLEAAPQQAEVLATWAKAVLADSRLEPTDYLEETVVPHGGE